MLSKTKKIALLTTGLVGALVASSAVGVALSSCTTNSTSTEVEENTKYNTYINWSDPDALTNLVVDQSGLVYSDIYKTTIIAITPSFTGTTVTIPASVRAITGYTEVLPSGQTIVRGAFQPTATIGNGSTAQSGVTLNNIISTVKFAANSKLKSIGTQAFSGCTLLQSIDLPATVTMIGNGAFSNCSLLESINLTNVEYIGSSAFANVATGLATSNISVSLNKAIVIGSKAFQNANIIAADFSSNTTLISLGDYAFDGCSSLAGTIDLSKATTLTTTGTYTFQNCTGITTVNLPSSLRSIGQYAFSGCSSIANTIDLSGATKLSTIGQYAFSGCTKLTGLSYPVSAPITSFGASAFNGCTALSQLGTVANTFTAPTALTSISANTFSGTSIATVDISNMTVATPFEDSALANMTSLTSVKFNTAITTLPAKLFEGDVALKTITLPTSITSITGGSSANTSGSTFSGSSLETVDMSAITSYSTTADMGTTVPTYLFASLTSLKNVVLKTGTTAIGSYAFQGTSGLVSVKEASQETNSGYTTTDTLTSIDNYAFYESGISSFTVTALKDTNATFSLGNYAFADATSLTFVDLTDATGLTTIPIQAFNSATALTTVKLPKPTSDTASLTISDGAFANVKSLTSIDFSKYTTLNIETNNFINANSLREIDLSNLTGTIPTFISSTNSTTFTGLPSGAVVKLSSNIDTIANSSVFTQPKADTVTTYTRVALEYPNGLTLSASNVNGGVLSNDANILSNVTGALDLSSNSNLTSIGVNTLFGNTKITSLTMPATNITGSTDLYKLGDVTAQTPSIASTKTDESLYTSANVPLGNNTALTSIKFDAFNVDNTIVSVGGLKQETFTAIAQIMNSYAYYKNSSSDASANAKAVSDPTNFKKWEVDADKNSWIQNDAKLTYSKTDNSQVKITLENVDVANSSSINNESKDVAATNEITFTSTASLSKKLTHNNIIWNLVYDANTQLITLTTDASTLPNIYKGKSANTTSSDNLQVYFNVNDNGTIGASSTQITMSIQLVPNKVSSN